MSTHTAATQPRPQLKLAEMPTKAPVVSDATPGPKRRGGWLRKIGLGAALVALLGTGGWYGYYWYMVGRYIVSTDDAYVRADMSALSAKVAGYVADIPVPENTLVKAGT